MNVLPPFANYCCPDCGVMHAKLPAEISVSPPRSVKLSRLNNIVRREFVTSHSLTKGFAHPAFLRSVAGIVLACAKEKMSRIHTRAIIAPMANEQSFRDFPIVKPPRNPVCSIIHWAFNIYSAIAFRVPVSRPFPTLIRLNLDHVSPKPNMQRCSHRAL